MRRLVLIGCGVAVLYAINPTYNQLFGWAWIVPVCGILLGGGLVLYGALGRVR